MTEILQGFYFAWIKLINGVAGLITQEYAESIATL